MNEVWVILQKIYTQNIAQHINILVENPISIIILCIDLLLVTYITIKIYGIIKDTDAVPLLKGIAILVIATILTGLFKFNILNYILKSVMTYGVFLIMIVFQPELRKTLGNLGNRGLGKFFNLDESKLNSSVVEEVIEVCQYLSSKNTGGLIILEKEIKLGDYINTGKKIQADVSKELIINLFEPNTPLHDGAIIIEGEKIKAAACILPLTKRSDLKSEFGTRHRAGIGISEVSDCISIIISEETGKISIAMDGKISTNLSKEQLEKFLKREIRKEIEE